MARGTTIIGLAKLQRKLDRLPKVAREHIQKEMAAAADEVVAMMKRQAPVLKEPDPRRVPGALRDSIGWTWGKAPKYASVVAVVKSKLGGDLTITIYAGNNAVRYAHLVEFGTIKMPATPFFYGSWRASKRGALRKVRKAVRDSAKQVAASS